MKRWYELEIDGKVVWSGASKKRGRVLQLIHGGTLYVCKES